MARRLFEGEDSWTDEASRAANSVQVALADILAIMEADGPIDLRDFHYMVSSTVGTFVAGLAIARRLGDPAEPPNPIVRAYPQLSNKIRNVTPRLEDGWEEWVLQLAEE